MIYIHVYHFAKMYVPQFWLVLDLKKAVYSLVTHRTVRLFFNAITGCLETLIGRIVFMLGLDWFEYLLWIRIANTISIKPGLDQRLLYKMWGIITLIGVPGGEISNPKNDDQNIMRKGKGHTYPEIGCQILGFSTRWERSWNGSNIFDVLGLQSSAFRQFSRN